MNTEHLDSFLAVAQRRNYTRAAEDLHLSQSAVWRQMRQLEGRLGVTLFEQIGKDLHLTEAGRVLEREARELLGHVGRLEQAVRGHGRQVLGRLRLGASTTPGFYLLPPVLGAFHEEHPEVELHLEIDNSAAIEQKLLRNELDVALVGGQVEHPELCTHNCLTDEVVCFSGPAHRLASGRRIDPSALRSELCVLREEGSATRRLFETWIESRGGLLERTMVLRCPEAVRRIVASGVGFSFLSVYGIGPEVKRHELVRLSVATLKLRRPIRMAWHVDKHLSPTLRTFIDRVETAFSLASRG